MGRRPQLSTAAFLIVAGSAVVRGEGLKYDAKGFNDIAYRANVTLKSKDGTVDYRGVITYAADPKAPQTPTSVPLRTRFDESYVVNPTRGPAVNVPSFHIKAGLYRPAEAGREIVIARDGTVQKLPTDANYYSEFPGMARYWYDIALPSLSPDGQNKWTTKRPVIFSHLAPGPGTRERVERKCQEVITCTSEPPGNGIVTVQQHYELISDESLNGVPYYKTFGDGSFEFDTTAGRMKSMSMELTSQAAGDRAEPLDYQVSVRLSLLPADEFAARRKSADASEERDRARLEKERAAEAEKAKAAAASAEAKAKAESAAAAERAKADAADIGIDADAAAREPKEAKSLRGKATRTLPPGMYKTDILPGPGNELFPLVSPEGHPIIGLAVRRGTWPDAPPFADFVPLYTRNAFLAKAGMQYQIILAKEGYALGAIWISANAKGVLGFRPVFFRKTETGLNPKDAYVIRWIGRSDGPTRTRLGGTGQVVNGLFIRHNQGVAGLGLVMMGEKPPAAAKIESGDSQAKDPTDDPNFAGTLGKP
jgi:hypothetical protein